MGQEEVEKQLEKDLLALKHAHSRQKLHHYQDQPDVAQMQRERRIAVGITVFWVVLFITMLILLLKGLYGKNN